MKTVGFERRLYILPFDHRGSLQKKLFGWTGALTADQTAQIAATKQVIYDGFKAALRVGVPEQKAGILTDEQFGDPSFATPGSAITQPPSLREKSGQAEFIFEYCEAFAEHIERIQPTFCKVLVATTPRVIRPSMRGAIEAALRIPAR